MLEDYNMNQEHKNVIFLVGIWYL